MAKEILTVVFVCYLFLLSSSQTPPLQPSEMSALTKIAGILGKTNWNFSVNPCIGEQSWRNLNPQKGFENDIACDCSASSCHITSILLKSQGLSGTLPKDLSGLPFLMQLDLTRNYLTGEIPKEWGKLKLVHLSLMSNRLSGPIPEELGNMITLKNITLDNNQFSGVLPPHIGNLTNLERLILSSNNFTGELPLTIARLTKMSDFRISGTRFSGRLPHFIENWTQLTVLSIQGTDLQGPLPSGLGRLTELRRLMISDIKGPSSRIPYLSQMNKLEILILRNCNLFGEIPEDIGRLPRLQHLDLSFNKISGNIPKLVDERTLRHMFLTSNNLTGLIPDWVFTSNINIDLSLNNLLGTANGRMPNCEQKNVNLVESYSAAVGNQRNIPSCLKKNYPCSEKNRYSSLFIDCGSKMTSTFEGKTFQEDGETSGAATLIEGPNQMWAMSSTGTYLDNEDPTDKYIAVNSSILSIANPELYMTARLSPLSLKYYGLCLYDGPYTVKLHFAEIVMTDDKNFSSLGQRIFDVYIQGNLVMKDFNIKEQAKGSGKSVILSIPANVTKSTLDIHLFWAGKGTTVVPYRGVYGPLLSAVELTADFRTPVTIGIKNIVAIVISALSVSLFSILLGIFCIRRVGKVQNRGGTFTLQQIKAATGNFDPSNQIGEGGFGPVYKGRLSDGTAVAVKRLASKSRQGNREFITETGIISALQHPNLVKLHGCCIEGDQLLLVYEYMENNSLSHALFARTPNRIKLDWPTRRKICLGIAKGLAYLHEESRLKIVHRDIKASNILLGKDLNAKISDFGLAKLEDDRNAHNNTRVVGTYGYIAPEYAMHGRLTCRADVYSFGIVALETVSGHSSGNKHCEECIYLVEWAYHLQEKGELLKLVDPEMEGNFCKEEAMIILNVALLCTDESPSRRPDMSMVVNMIEGKTCIQPRPMLSHSNEKNRQRSASDERSNREGSQNRSWTTSVSDPSRHDIGSGHHNTRTSETPSSMEIVSIHSANKIYSPPNEPTERLLPWTA